MSRVNFEVNLRTERKSLSPKKIRFSSENKTETTAATSNFINQQKKPSPFD